MTSADQSHHRPMMRLAHLHTPAVIAAVLPVAVSTFVPQESPGGHLLSVYWPAALVFLGAITLAGLIHGDALCEHCGGAIPDNPGADAERKMIWFRLFHFHHAKIVVLACACLFAPALLGVWFPVAIAAGLEIVHHFTHKYHTKFGSWCPWCRDDGGDDDAPVQLLPVPTGEGRNSG